MELDGIDVFVEVVEARSFAKAAQRLRMPPATVSAKIARLEQRLGVTLIRRTTRTLHVTPAGETYYAYCARAVAEMREAQQQLTVGAAEPQGKLRITAPLNLAQTVLPPIVERFLSKCPKVSIELMITNKTLDLLAEGIDLAIRAGQLQDSTLTARTFFQTRLCLWASKDYVARYGAPAKPEDLAQHAIVGFSSKMRLPDLHSGRRSLPLPAGRIVCDDMECIRTYVLRGNGIGLMQETSGEQDQLVRVLPEFATSPGPVSLVYPAQKFVPPAVRAFITVATEGATAGLAKHASSQAAF